MSLDVPSPHASAPADAWAEHVFSAALGAIDILAIHLGDRLGWYRALASDGPLTADDLARLTGTHPRYAREWLEQQATSGLIVAIDDGPMRFALPAGAAEALTDTRSLAYIAPLARMLAGAAAQMPALLDAYRTGRGVSWEQLGDDARWSQADMNRPWFEQMLGEAIEGVPEIHDVLEREDARIVDVACGAGWSTIALAHAYPGATIVGVDIDAPSIEMARVNAAEAGVAGRVEFVAMDSAELTENYRASFDGTFIFEALHDMPRPVEVLDAIRACVKSDGVVVVMDEGVGDAPVSVGDEVERLMYGFSLFVCLPDGMSSQPSAGTGTVMRPSVLASYAREAGFSSVSVLPIDGFSFFRFYRLHLRDAA
ncbi:methyltransferase domain-containing protein [Demequina sp. SYSU T00068]|uniref:class I SAM-dependent methyltransferase n=1 Tax=Demequina lignilytica TaxID=3051663 RepID=UPI002612C1A7|nr:class I SAM-dependent methyltransferase [Demequina sp. SYSU T00068]MDN4491205.1 methyltransferase domain-containing protein [Demequina sp. SYSU T00068]